MTAREKLEKLRAEIKQLTATPCVGCGHPLGNHASWQGGRCTPLLNEQRANPCRCKRFVDPSETLAVGTRPSNAVT